MARKETHFLEIADLRKSFGQGEARQLMHSMGQFFWVFKIAMVVLSVVYLLMGYGFVSVIDYLRIRRIPTDTALKNMDM